MQALRDMPRVIAALQTPDSLSMLIFARLLLSSLKCWIQNS